MSDSDRYSLARTAPHAGEAVLIKAYQGGISQETAEGIIEGMRKKDHLSNMVCWLAKELEKQTGYVISKESWEEKAFWETTW